MIIAKILLCIASVFAALGLYCAVTVGRRAPSSQSRHFGVASRPAKRVSSAPADAYSEAFGDVPSTGFTTEQLRILAPPVMTRDPLLRSFAPDETICQADRLRHELNESGPALRPDAGSGGINGRPFPSGRPATVRGFLGKGRR